MTTWSTPLGARHPPGRAARGRARYQGLPAELAHSASGCSSMDLPEVLEFKRQVLASQAAQPRCDYRPVPADLREDWAALLTEVVAGLRIDQPTAWLLEGLLIYLSAAEVAHVLSTLDELSATGSWVAFESETADAETLQRQAGDLPALAEYADLWQGGLPDPAGWPRPRATGGRNSTTSAMPQTTTAAMPLKLVRHRLHPQRPAPIQVHAKPSLRTDRRSAWTDEWAHSSCYSR